MTRRALERLNAPQMRRDWLAERYKLIILAALVVCAAIAALGAN